MRSYSRVVAFLVVGLGAPGMAHAQQGPQAPTGDWTNKQGGDNFYYGAGATDGSYLYIYGGVQVNSPNPTTTLSQYQRLRQYDPSNDSWTWLADMPEPLLYNAGAYSGGRLFSFGGIRYTWQGTYWSGTATNLIYAYDIANDSWETLGTTLTVSRYYATAATVTTADGDRIYIVGGTPGTGTNDEFDPDEETLTSRATLTSSGSPVQIYLHAMAQVSGKIYVMGGLPGPTANVYEYTLPTGSSPNGSWSSRAPVQNAAGQNQAGYYRHAFGLNGRVYLTGGLTSPYNQTFEYNPPTNTWTQRDNMNGGRYGHVAMTLNSKGWVYGGLQAYSTLEEYTPPDFGSAPHLPTGLAQTGSRSESSIQAKDELSQFDGWTNSQITFSANVTDPNAGQQVRLRVQVKPEAAAWGTSSVVSLDSGLRAQGAISIPWTIPAGGGYDWRWRVEDSYQNSHPLEMATTAAGWVEGFANSESPDFRSDQVTPADPVAVYPADTDIQVPDPAVGTIELRWLESTDNGPVAGISYEIQVAHEGGFNEIEAQLFSTAGTSTYPIELSVSRFDKFWRIRARDVGGNLSNWSDSLRFRVTHNDGINHSSGDADKYCGFGAFGAPAVAGALFGLMILGFSVIRRKLS